MPIALLLSRRSTLRTSALMLVVSGLVCGAESVFPQPITITGGHLGTKLNLDCGDPSLGYLSLWASEPGRTYIGTGIADNYRETGIGTGIWDRVRPERGASILKFLNGVTTLTQVNTSGAVANELKMGLDGVAAFSGSVSMAGYPSWGGGGEGFYGSGSVTSSRLGVESDRPGNPWSVFRMNWHTGLTFTAHSAYGGIRIYNQGYPDMMGSATLVAAFTNNRAEFPRGMVAGNSRLNTALNGSGPGLVLDASTRAVEEEAVSNLHIIDRLGRDSFRVTVGGDTIIGGSLRANGGVHNLGVGVGQNVLVLDGGNSGPRDGAAVYGRIAGNINWALGTKSSILGSGYDARTWLYHTNDLHIGYDGGHPAIVVKAAGRNVIVGDELVGRTELFQVNGSAGVNGPLAVNGTITAKEVIVTPTGWSDSVFDEPRSLNDLETVAAHIAEHKHLPGIPSAATVAKDGVNTGDQFAAQLAQIERLTLHAIDLKRERDRLAAENAQLKGRQDRMDADLLALTARLDRISGVSP